MDNFIRKIKRLFIKEPFQGFPYVSFNGIDDYVDEYRSCSQYEIRGDNFSYQLSDN